MCNAIFRLQFPKRKRRINGNQRRPHFVSRGNSPYERRRLYCASNLEAERRRYLTSRGQIRKWLVDGKGQIKRYGIEQTPAARAIPPNGMRTRTGHSNAGRRSDGKVVLPPQPGNRSQELPPAEPQIDVQHGRKGKSNRDNKGEHIQDIREEDIPKGWTVKEYRTFLRATTRRSELVAKAEEHRKILERHLQGYNDQLQKHVQGQNPGFRDWRPDWTKERFDQQHLFIAMRLSRGQRIKDECLVKFLRICSSPGAVPLASQSNHFPHPDAGYAEREEDRMKASAPAEMINSWDDGLVDAAGDFAGRRPSEVLEGNLNLYARDHVVGYPNTMASAVRSETGPGDSISLRGRNTRDIVMAPGQTDIVTPNRPAHSDYSQLANPVKWEAPSDVRKQFRDIRQRLEDEDPKHFPPQLDDKIPKGHFPDPKALRSHMG
ncbi:uncharacterized protein LTR77_007704 [Saxophila tyrrhenica]|uniref:Uncharacterized protein n=1 Tax=Saxophila tyrrhenica TaxID=1690608 RepID=A0AAV9P5N2_9PEZI|nr:hypothetical protein LTR77_007704 [Saxophila tyrrhenica]